MLTLLDGPLGTELAARGVATPHPQWSAHAIDHAPDIVAQIHRDYADAGAAVHTTNTFRAKRRTVGDAWERLTRRAVALARCAVPKGHAIAGSLSPLEDCYRPDLNPPDAASAAEHREVARVLADAGVDLILCETFPNPREAAIAVAEAVRTGLPTWVALTAGPDASLMTPEAMEAAARICAREGAQAVLVNCVPASKTLPYVERLARVGLPFGAYANAGRADEGIGWGGGGVEGPRTYAALARTWVLAGATIVGGCCGTGPRHIAEMARLFATGSAPA
jgi:S-methylmethionine-dependent homocysteine/selenocysteine methylase